MASDTWSSHIGHSHVPIRYQVHLPIQEEYNDAIKEMAAKWSDPFYQYYQQQIHAYADINSIAR